MFAIRATRPFFLKGKVIAIGTIAMACAADALSAVGANRAEFVDPTNRAFANDEVRTSDEEAARRANPKKPSFWALQSMNGGHG